MSRESLYTRLTPSVSGATSYTSLWLGPDHLMLLRSTGVNESYQRFAFSDIRAFVIGSSIRHRIWSGLWASIALLFLWFSWASFSNNGVFWIPLGFSAGAATAFTVNLLRGPSCRLFMVTRVQTLRVPVVRRRRAEALIARLEPLIAAAQSDLVAAPAGPPLVPPDLQ